MEVEAMVVVMEESGSGCAGILPQLGKDTDVSMAFDGLTRTYGYDPEFLGHAELIMLYDATAGWIPGGFASFDMATQSLSYDLEDGYYTY